MRTRFTIITLMALILTTASSQITCAAASDGNQVPSVYIQLKAAAEARQDELLYLLEQDLSSEVMRSLETALQLMRQAEEADPQTSTQYYLDALRYFRETWKNYLTNNEDLSTNTLEKPEPDTLPVLKSNQELETEIKENKVRLLNKFQEKIEAKYASFINDIEEMAEFLPEEDSVEAQKKLQNAQDKLGKIREKLQKGEFDDALSSLDADLGTFKDDIDYLSDKNESKTVRKIEVMNGWANKEKVEKEQKENDNEDNKNDNQTNSGNGNDNSNNGNSGSNNGNTETGNNSGNTNSENSSSNNGNGNTEPGNNSGTGNSGANSNSNNGNTEPGNNSGTGNSEANNNSNNGNSNDKSNNGKTEPGNNSNNGKSNSNSKTDYPLN